METKKNPKANVGRNSGLYFAVGMLLMLGLTYTAINYKTYDERVVDNRSIDVDDELDEDIPITNQAPPPPPPPPPPPTPEVIDVVEDEEEIVETVMETTETTQDEVIAEVEEIEVEEIEEDVEVSFAVIESVPIFPGCEKGNNDQKRKCMSDAINKLVRKKFDLDLGQQLELEGKQRIYARFTIDKTGNITNVKVRGPHKELEKEARRVVGLIPNMKPGKQRGKPVKVTFDLPITFNVQ